MLYWLSGTMISRQHECYRYRRAVKKNDPPGSADALSLSGLFKVFPAVTQNLVAQMLNPDFYLLGIGMLVASITAGQGDSEQTMGYEEPWDDNKCQLNIGNRKKLSEQVCFEGFFLFIPYDRINSDILLYHIPNDLTTHHNAQGRDWRRKTISAGRMYEEDV